MVPEMQTAVYTSASGVPGVRGETQAEIDHLRSLERRSQTQERRKQVNRTPEFRSCAAFVFSPSPGVY